MTQSHRTSLWTCLLRRTAIGGALGLAALASFAAGTARAQDADADDNTTTIWNWDKKVMNSVMHSLGLQNGTEGEIDYHERSPLVVPPTRTLPPPQTSAAVPAPNWPVDPDVKRHTETKTKHTAATNTDQDWLDLTGNQLPSANKAQGGTGGTSTQASNGTGGDIEASKKPSDLGYAGNLFGSLFKSNTDDETGTFTGEKPRTSLIEPPTGYQTPSPGQPYGLSKKRDYGKPIKAEDIPVGNVGL
jgi:hypothetical protein